MGYYLAPMSINKLPNVIKPLLLCKSAGADIAGQIKAADVLALSKELKQQALTPITCQLRFYVADDGFCTIEGEMVGDFELICQRCMQPMRYVLKAEILVSPVNSDSEAKQLPSRYDPLMMHNGEVNFAEWIAEELHLALPLVPRHETDCVSSNYLKGE